MEGGRVVRPDTVVARAEGAFSAPVDDEVVLLSPRSDAYVALDAVGRAVWDLLKRPLRLSELVAAVRDRYDGDPDEIAADVAAFVVELAAEGVVQLRD